MSKETFRDPAMGEPNKRITRMRYGVGPMGYLADQIMKNMQMAGYPVREFNLYRSPFDQLLKYQQGYSKALPFSGAHQFYGASDLIHEKWAWFDPSQDGVPDGTKFWNTLWDCVEVVAEKHNVEFRDRISWDPAHIELANWRDFREVVLPNWADARKTDDFGGYEGPNQTQLDWYFQVTLPKEWRQYQRSKAVQQ